MDEPDNVPAEVEIDEVRVRMECLQLVVAAGANISSPVTILVAADQFAAFVIHGTVPATN